MLLRALLRSVRKQLQVDGGDHSALLRDATQYIVHSARAARSQPDLAGQQPQLAQDYVNLVNNIAHHKVSCAPTYTCTPPLPVCQITHGQRLLLLHMQELLVRYRIGMDESERSKEMIEATARRVGFDLPSSRPAEHHGGSGTTQQGS